MGPDNDVPDLPPVAGAVWPRLAEGAEAATADRESDGPVILPLPCPCCGRPRPPRHPAA
ncbi:MAG TPA: hypothetical protein VFE78_33495 [Gemmataceae bacterium]|jgi:hypothetical protein|nr:hypothetical protein [Gemmataceae bacterium]